MNGYFILTAIIVLLVGVGVLIYADIKSMELFRTECLAEGGSPIRTGGSLICFR